MNTNKTINITNDLLNQLENSSGLVELTTEADFLDAIKLNRAIIYLLVDWSGQERFSRYVVFKAFNNIDKIGIPIFKIDCSEQTKKYVEDWLVGQRENKKEFYYGGWGETILTSKGNIIDFIKNPGQLGHEQTVKKIDEWKNTTANSSLPKVGL